MKLNYNLWLLGALALGMGACTADDEFTGIPQVNPQPDVLPANCVKGNNVYAPGSTIDVDAAYKTNHTGDISLLDITKLDAQPAGYALKVKMVLAKTVAELSDPSARIDTTLSVVSASKAAGSEGSYGINWSALNTMFHDLVGVNDATAPLAMRFDAYTVSDNSQAYLGTVGETGLVNVKPVQYAYTPESSYYMINTEDPTVQVELKNAGGSVWSDGKFSGVVTLPAGTTSWRILPASQKANPASAKGFGPAKSDSIKGDLTLGAAAGKLTIKESGPYMFSIDMTAHSDNYSALMPTYDIKLAYSALYVLGNAQGGDATPGVLTTKDYVNYGGFIAFSGWGAKMTDKPSWGGTEFANFNFEGPDAKGTYTGKVGSGNASGNINGLPDGLYAWTFNMTTKEVKATPITKVQFIGDAVGGWSEPREFTPANSNPDCTEWSAEITFTGNTDFKLRGVLPSYGNDWAFSLGGDMTSLVWDGPNTKYTGSLGKHKVTVNFNVAKTGAYASAPRVHYVIE